MEYPQYVRLGGVALRHSRDGVYGRIAGQWSIGSEWKDGKLLAKSTGQMAHANGTELLPCSKEEHDEDNAGYM